MLQTSDGDVWSLPSVPRQRKAFRETDGQGRFHAVLFREGGKKKLSLNPLNPRFSFMLCSALSGGFVFLSFHSDLLIIYLSADTSAQMPSAVCWHPSQTFRFSLTFCLSGLAEHGLTGTVISGFPTKIIKSEGQVSLWADKWGDCRNRPGSEALRPKSHKVLGKQSTSDSA